MEGEVKAVAVNGFLVISRLPSKELLDAHLPEIFKGVRIGRKEVQLVMGYFYNRLGTLSRKFYNQIRGRYAIDVGFAHILPRDKVPEFLRDVDALKREYEEYEEQLKGFLLRGEVPPEVKANKRAKVYEDYLNTVQEYLRQHGREEEVKEKIERLRIADRVYIRLIPFSIDLSILEEYIDEKVRRRLEQELYETKKEIASRVKEQLEAKARALVEKMEQYLSTTITQTALQNMRRELEEIEKTAKEFGVTSNLLSDVKELVDIATKGEIQQAKKLAENIKASMTSARLRALLGLG